MVHDMSELVDKRHRKTRAAIADEAIMLFTERGLRTVTMDDIGKASGVSRRTAYRHLPSKDELAVEHPRSWVRVFDDCVESGSDDADETARQKLLRCLRAVAVRIDDTAPDGLFACNVHLLNAGLRGSHASIDDEWFARFSAIIGDDQRAGHLRHEDTATAAGASVGTINRVLLARPSQSPAKSMVALAKRSLPRVLELIPR